MKIIINGIMLVALIIWIVKEYRGAKKHMDDKKSLGLSNSELIKVLEKSVGESWAAGLFYGCLFGIIALLFFQGLKNFIF